jgi:hypothetical protein
LVQASRPLSPHLGIHRWYFTMALPIAHRVTSAGLTVGLILPAWWLLALAGGPESFAKVQAAMDNILGGLILFGFTLSLFYPPAKLRLARATMADPETNVDDLCRELGVTRQTLYRHVGPAGELREDGRKLLQRPRR